MVTCFLNLFAWTIVWQVECPFMNITQLVADVVCGNQIDGMNEMNMNIVVL